MLCFRYDAPHQVGGPGSYCEDVHRQLNDMDIDMTDRPWVHHPNISYKGRNWLNSVVILTSFHLEIHVELLSLVSVK